MTKLLLTFFLVLFFTLPLFAQSVDTAWVRKYNGPGNSRDVGNDIKVDNSGNVYVTGFSMGSGTYDDYCTIKYYPNGGTAWVKRYNGYGNYFDDAHAITVDGSGNVYVTGKSYENSYNYDYTTIKYYSNGDIAWRSIYSGPGNENDEAYAIAVDSSGNVYVTGHGYASWTYEDYVTVKYDSLGYQLWVKTYNGPGNGGDYARALAMDNSGNIYVTGFSWGSGTDFDYATIKYNSNGDTAWVRRYNGPGNYIDNFPYITVDNSGNVYVTGQSAQSNEYPNFNYDYATIKYFPNGDTAWVRRYNGPGNSTDEAHAIAVDSSGNVYVTGSSWGSSTNEDYATIKYYPNGDTAWVRRYNGLADSTDKSCAIAVDNSGNVYVTGTSWGNVILYDCVTIRYNSNGDIVWARRYESPSWVVDMGNAITVDNSGNVYVTGSSSGDVTGLDYATIKYVQFLRGDANSDKKVTIADIVYLVSYLFKHGPAPAPIQSGDANCDGNVTIADIVYLVAYLFKHGPVPCI